MKQSTAIRRAYALQNWYDKIKRSGEWWLGKNPVTGRYQRIGHVTQITTHDWHGHSTVVRNNGTRVATVYGTID